MKPSRTSPEMTTTNPITPLPRQYINSIAIPEIINALSQHNNRHFGDSSPPRLNLQNHPSSLTHHNPQTTTRNSLNTAYTCSLTLPHLLQPQLEHLNNILPLTLPRKRAQQSNKHFSPRQATTNHGAIYGLSQNHHTASTSFPRIREQSIYQIWT